MKKLANSNRFKQLDNWLYHRIINPILGQASIWELDSPRKVLHYKWSIINSRDGRIDLPVDYEYQRRLHHLYDNHLRTFSLYREVTRMPRKAKKEPVAVQGPNGETLYHFSNPLFMDENICQLRINVPLAVFDEHRNTLTLLSGKPRFQYRRNRRFEHNITRDKVEFDANRIQQRLVAMARISLPGVKIV